jgi:uncharacterized protein (DUF1778 family)
MYISKYLITDQLRSHSIMASEDTDTESTFQTLRAAGVRRKIPQEGLIMAARDKRKEHIYARLTAETKQQIDQAAALQGRSTSDFMVQAALKEASQVIDQQRIIRLTVEESVALAKLMTSEPKVNEASVAAMRRQQKIIGS